MGRLKVYNPATALWEYVAEAGGFETTDSVLVTRTINGKALSSNIVLTPTDIGAAADDDARLSDDRDPTVHGSDKHAVAYLDSTDIITYIGSVQPTVTQPSLWVETNAISGDVESMWLVDVGDNI